MNTIIFCYQSGKYGVKIVKKAYFNGMWMSIIRLCKALFKTEISLDLF